jgi:hypothetical protein
MPDFLDVATDLRAALRALRVVVVGCGAVGLAVVDTLARLALDRMVVVDPALFKDVSVLTHPCLPEDLARPKAIVAAERAKQLSPDTQVLALEGCFEELPLGLLAGTSFLIVSSDNLRAEVSVSQRALHLGIPVLQGSVHGGTLTAQVRSIAVDGSGAGPCLACGFTQREWSDLDAGTVFSCSGTDSSSNAPAEHSPVPTESLPYLCRMAADLLSLEMTRRLLGIGDPQESREVSYTGYTHRTVVTPLRRSATCPLEHTRLELAPRKRSLGESAPRDLLREAGYDRSDLRRVTIAVEGWAFSSLAVCGCDAHAALGRFLPAGSAAGTCPSCRAQRWPHPLHTAQEIPVSALAGRLDCTLGSLGADAPTSVRLRGERGGVLFIHSSTPGPAGEEQRGHE